MTLNWEMKVKAFNFDLFLSKETDKLTDSIITIENDPLSKKI